jgi:acetylglutamate kinase
MDNLDRNSKLMALVANVVWEIVEARVANAISNALDDADFVTMSTVEGLIEDIKDSGDTLDRDEVESMIENHISNLTFETTVS